MKKRQYGGDYAKSIVALSLILSVLVLCSSCGQSEEAGPREITQKYFDAVKIGDIDGAIKCFTPAVQQQYSSAVALGGMLSKMFVGMDGSSLLNGFMSYADADAYAECEFIVDDVEFTDDEHKHAQVHVTVDGASNGIPGETTVQTIKYDGKWYIEQ